jgi:hypothetical protein
MPTNYFNGLSKEEAIKELVKLGIKFEATKWNRKKWFMTKSNIIKYFTQYKDFNNKIHYSVNSYNNSDRSVQMFKDIDLRKTKWKEK